VLPLAFFLETTTLADPHLLTGIICHIFPRTEAVFPLAFFLEAATAADPHLLTGIFCDVFPFAKLVAKKSAQYFVIHRPSPTHVLVTLN
jgi:hypothetical protein